MPRTHRAFHALFGLLALAATAAAQPDAGPDAVRYDGDKVVRVQIRNGDDVLTMDAISGDPWQCRALTIGPVDYRVPRDRLADLDASGLQYQVLINDLQAMADAETAAVLTSRLEGGGAGGSWFQAYHNYADIGAYVDQLVATFPSMASRQSVGMTLQGREIFAIRIAAPGAPADRPAIILHGLQHAREWITGGTVMYIADRLLRCSSDPQVAAALANVQFIIVPVLNPDGYNHTWVNNRFWRKNRRPNPNGSFGVDLNRNWGQGWGGQGSSGTQGSDTYRGPSAFSEMETQALRDFISARPFIKAHFDVHSYGQLILSPWGHTAVLPPDHALFADLNAVMHDAFLGVHAMEYRAGPTYTNIYPASGTANDWTYGARGILGWGFELRDTGQTGFALPPEQIIATGEETYAAIMAVADALGHPLRFTFPDGVPAVVPSDTDTNVRVVVSPMSAAVQSGSPTLLYRVGRVAPFGAAPLMPVAGTEYLATLPAVACGGQVQFFFQATAVGGAAEYSPGAASEGPFVARAGQGVPLVACPGCPGDFNADGFRDPDDLADFITCFFVDVQSPGSCPESDVNGDGFRDPDDLADFITTFFLGC